MRADLALLDTLAPPLGAALPRRRRARAAARRARADARRAGLRARGVDAPPRARVLRDIDGIVVPRVHGELCAEGVFVAGLLEGKTLADGARPADPSAAAGALVHAHVAAAQAGIALLDARPGHVLVLQHGKIGLLGTGLARPVDRARVALALDALIALRADDDRAFGAAVAQAGVLPAAAATEAHQLARAALGPLASGEAKLDAAAICAALDRAIDTAGAIFGWLRRRRRSPTTSGSAAPRRSSSRRSRGSAPRRTGRRASQVPPGADVAASMVHKLRFALPALLALIALAVFARPWGGNEPQRAGAQCRESGESGGAEARDREEARRATNPCTPAHVPRSPRAATGRAIRSPSPTSRRPTAPARRVPSLPAPG